MVEVMSSSSRGKHLSSVLEARPKPELLLWLLCSCTSLKPFKKSGADNGFTAPQPWFQAPGLWYNMLLL